MIRMHCFSISRLGALLLQDWWSVYAGPLFHKCGVAGWLGKKGLQNGVCLAWKSPSFSFESPQMVKESAFVLALQ